MLSEGLHSPWHSLHQTPRAQKVREAAHTGALCVSQASVQPALTPACRATAWAEGCPCCQRRGNISHMPSYLPTLRAGCGRLHVSLQILYCFPQSLCLGGPLHRSQHTHTNASAFMFVISLHLLVAVKYYAS